MAQIPGQEDKEKTTALKGKQLATWSWLPCIVECDYVITHSWKVNVS